MTVSSDSSPSPISPDPTPVPDFRANETGDKAANKTMAGRARKGSSQKWPSRKWGILLLALLSAGIGFAAWRAFAGRGQPAMQGPPAFPVKVERLQRESLEDSSEFVGNLDSRAGVSLQPEADGQVVQIFVSSGDRVTAGDPIMQLSAERSQSDYNAALSNITAASAARDAAEAQLRAALARKAQLEADLALQVNDYARTATLVDRGALAAEQLDQAVRDRTVAQAAISSAEQEIQALNASREQAQATLAQANNNASATQQDLLDKTVTAPITGIVGDIPVKLGDYVTAGAGLATITQNQDLDLEINVDIGNAPRLRTGLPVELMLTGQDNVVATGTISFVSPTIDPTNQTILAKARFSSPTQPLQNDQRLSVRVIWDQRPGILIPTTAVSRLGGETFVFVPGEPDPPTETEGAPPGAPPEGTGAEGPPPVVARLKPVKLGDLQGNEYQVLEGLSPGDTVITSGLLNLRDGVPIAPQNESSAMSE
ncbi:MAG: Multidrug resistance efflux pump [Phormidesmis priestleyi Ana]|uniref:Multidrug resistance efflux pump n=1 Tax=Phormidesmis priestleyi Ana TaxID=1666911 RepID=A0A0P7ZMJ2_9CYAN|nr:MAG: Multidrug resistance efflux pump [Phormidesmis priestleyi Ana]